MASSSEASEDSLITAQRALAVIFEDAYPCSNTIRQGLEEILNQRFGGSQHEFTNQFITPTILLLKRLKEKGFPLVKEGKVIVHLLAPSNHLESGEMFYQIGHTTPGTLALKFTKYKENLVVLQPATIKEQELYLAFTQQYIEEMRKKATGLGDQLMRVLLTSRKNGQGVYVIDKIEVKKIMPYSSSDCTASVCHPPVMETGMPKCFEASESQHFPATGNWPDQAIGSQTGPTPDRQPQEHSSVTSANNLPLLVQAVRSDSQKPATGHQTNDHVGDDSSPVTGHHSPNPNQVYPVLVQAAQDDPVTSATGHQSQEHFSTSSRSNPPYPPLVQAVRDDPSSPVTVHQSKERSSSGSGTNPVCPSRVQSVTTSATGHQCEEHPLSGSGTNPPYPPLSNAVKDDPTTSATDHQSKKRSRCGSGSNPVTQAVRDNPMTSATGHQCEEHPLSRNGTNPPYPPLSRAVKDDPTISATDHQSKERPRCGSESNPAYPPVTQAVRDNPTTSATGHQCEEHPFSGSGTNPPYPLLSKAVKDDPTTSATDHQSKKRPRCGSGSNPAYPPVTQAVKDNPTTSATGDQSQEYSSTGHTSNLVYPPIMQAVRDNPLVTPATDHQPVNNPTQSPGLQATVDGPTTTVRDRNPCMPVDDLDLF